MLGEVAFTVQYLYCAQCIRDNGWRNAEAYKMFAVTILNGEALCEGHLPNEMED